MDESTHLLSRRDTDTEHVVDMNRETKWHYKEIDDVLKTLKLDASTKTKGISANEASKRLKEYGRNEIAEKKFKFPLWVRLLYRQTINLMSFVLLAAAIISAIVHDYVDATVIFVIIIINIIIGFLQEYRSETTMQKLKDMTARTCTVVRDGKNEEIPSAELVPGDLVVLAEGDQVPADMRIIACSSISCNESLLTGESVPSNKTADMIKQKPKHGRKPTLDEPIEVTNGNKKKKVIPLGDRTNMAFMNTCITRGEGKAIVVQTGMKTEIGKIASELESGGDEETPLQKRMNRLGIVLVAVGIFSSLLVIVVNLLYKKYKMFPDSFLIAVTIGVAIIPESLVAVVTLTMSLGMRNMARHNAIVRKLSALESLGGITDICTDKTGTLTQGVMVAKSIWVDQLSYNIENDKIVNEEKKGEQPLSLVLTTCSLCNSSTLEEEKATGDPTEVALSLLVREMDMSKEKLEKDGYSKIEIYPFDTDLKRSSVVYSHEEKIFSFVKGASESIIELCTSYMGQNGESVSITEQHREDINKANESLASDGLRVLCVAYRHSTQKIEQREHAEKELTFLGLVGIYDAPRKEAAKSVRMCHEAGITVRMVTGDHPNTALSIAKQVGIVNKDSDASSLVMKASKFDKLTDEQLNAMKELPLVIARCSPQSKAKLIKALHMRDRRAAMTGDGVNDAPAIKCADIGIAMGASGSDVTVEASDIVLTTDNFSTIVEAISEGRRIFANIRKFVIHLLSANTAQLFALLIPVLIGYKVPLTATQILWLNMITGTPPAIGLGIEKGARKIMKRPPATGLFTNETNLDILFYGMLMAAITLVSFFTVTDLWLHKSLTSAQGVAFTSLTIMLLLHAYNCRHSRKSFFMEGCAKSWLLHGAVIFGLVMQCLVLYIPWLNTEVFKVHPLAPAEWLLVACGGLAFMLTAEAYKLTKRAVLATIKRRREKKSRKNILVASVQEISLV